MAKWEGLNSGHSHVQNVEFVLNEPTCLYYAIPNLSRQLLVPVLSRAFLSTTQRSQIALKAPIPIHS